ncbi:MAG: tetratricopeptide repeat protein [Thermodesulfobacteriota bacterium]
MERARKSIWILLAVAICMAACATSSQVSTKKRAEAKRRLGIAYMAEGKDAAAFKELSEAQKLNPDDPNVYYALGIFYFNKEKYDKAIESYNKCLELEPNFAPVRNNLGLAYLAKGEYDTAIVHFKELTENYIYGTPHYPLYGLGRAYYLKEEYVESEKYFQKALDLEPKYTPAMLGLGRIYIQTGKPEQAIAVLQKGIEIEPKYAELHFELAKALALTHQKKNALRSLEKVIELKPDSAMAKEAKELLRKR